MSIPARRKIGWGFQRVGGTADVRVGNVPEAVVGEVFVLKWCQRGLIFFGQEYLKTIYLSIILRDNKVMYMDPFPHPACLSNPLGSLLFNA
jgi:hypothetical protein